MNKLWIPFALCIACAGQESSECLHGDRGDSHPVSLEAVGRAQDELKRRLALSWDRSAKLSLDASFDSGLPACRVRQTRRLRSSVPPELLGKTLVFAPADRLPDADVRVATSARRLVEVQADALADRALIDRLGIRCTPTLVRALSEVEFELLENP